MNIFVWQNVPYFPNDPRIYGLWVADGSIQTSVYNFAHCGTKAYFLA